MGKQRSKSKTKGIRIESTNNIDWEIRARELVRLGLCRPIILDHAGYTAPSNR